MAHRAVDTVRSITREPGGGHGAPGRVPHRVVPVAVLGTLLAVAVAARLFAITGAYELFIDEVTYTDLGLSVAIGEGVRLHGEPFHLHPPGLFLVLAGVMGVLSLTTEDLGTLTYAMRPVPAVLGSVTPVLVTVLVRRATRSWALAACGGALLVLEPFLIRFDSRVLLEAQAMCFAAAGFVGLTWLLDRHRRGATAAWPAVLVGLLMAASMLTKETYASVAVLPVLVLLVTRLVLPRRTTVLVLASTVTTYLVYVLVLGFTGQLGEWFESKTSGVRRLLGLTQMTGFNSDTHSVSLVDRILVNLANFAVTYSLIGLGAVATLWLLLVLRRGHPVPAVDRPVAVLVVVWALCAIVHLSYAVTLGTLEEQMFYLLVVTAVPAVCVAARVLLTGPRPPLLRRTSPRVLGSLLALGLAAAVTVNAVVWWRVHTVPDDAYARFLAWADAELPRGSRVVTTDETTQFVLDNMRVIRLETGAEARDFRAEYVLILTELVEQGYSTVDTEMLGIIDQGRLVFSAEGRTIGELRVYDVSDVTA
jgi:dolichyl-phosphate-mannose-protein mannosyltransferase